MVTEAQYWHARFSYDRFAIFSLEHSALVTCVETITMFCDVHGTIERTASSMI